MPSTLLRISVGEDGFNTLHTLASLRNRDLETVAAEVLRAALRDLPLDGRYVVITGDELDRLEGILSGGSILNSIDLFRKVERLAGITFNNVRFEFTPGQLEELQSRADRLGLTVDELCRRTVAKMQELFFTHLGVGAHG
jgi:hypothetical protein